MPDHRSGRVRREPFVMAPIAQQFGDDAVSPTASRLWNVLDDLARDDDSVEVSPSALGTALGLSAKTITRLAAQLAAAGWIRYEPGTGRGKTSTWWPLRRPRHRSQPVGNPVRNAVGIGAQAQRKVDTNVHLSTRETSTSMSTFSSRDTNRNHAGEEGRTQTAISAVDDGYRAGAPRHPVPWCGQPECDPVSRLRSYPDPERPGHELACRCHCHPAVGGF